VETIEKWYLPKPGQGGNFPEQNTCLFRAGIDDKETGK
jgi:hypothetical protein